MQSDQVQSLGEELDPTCHNLESACHNKYQRFHIPQPTQPNKFFFLSVAVKIKTSGYFTDSSSKERF